MKIMLIGSLKGNLDEGMHNITFNLYRELSKEHEVLLVDTKNPFVSFKKVRSFKPEIIHYIHGPTFLSFLLTKFLSIRSDAKTVLSAPQPKIFNSPFASLASFIRPSIVLAQSRKSEIMFKRMGIITSFLPNGVNINKFLPASHKRKEALREKYGVDNKKFIVLHVGPIKKNRNVNFLTKIQSNKIQVIIVCSTSFSPEKEVYIELLKSGCLVWKCFFSNIEEIYQLSDCYIFPVTDPLGCIEIPLSVMEAMSCNLPVISTAYGGLPDIFSEGKGLFFVKKLEEIPDKLKEAKSVKAQTRRLVLPYSWEKIVKKLVRIYHKLIDGCSLE